MATKKPADTSTDTTTFLLTIVSAQVAFSERITAAEYSIEYPDDQIRITFSDENGIAVSHVSISQNQAFILKKL